MASIEPSQQRLSRIAASLCWEPNTSIYSKPSVSQTHLEETVAVHDLPRDAVNISDEISIEENEFNKDGVSAELESKTQKTYGGTNMEETEMRRTAQALFESEESLLDQHITNIKVSL
jgi:hypothetical protein